MPPTPWIDVAQLVVAIAGGAVALGAFVWAVATWSADLRYRSSEAARGVHAVVERVSREGDEQTSVPPETEHAVTVELGEPPYDHVQSPHHRQATLLVEVRNRGREPVGPVYLGIGDRQDSRLDGIWREIVADVPSIAPERAWVVSFQGWGVDWSPSERGTALYLILRDASGMWWQRVADGPVSRVPRRKRRALNGRLGIVTSPDRVSEALLHPPAEPRPGTAGAAR